MTDITKEAVEEISLEQTTPTPTPTTTQQSAQQSASSSIVPPKRIDALTDSEKELLISNARAGIENPYYNVKLYKNGNTRICKKKSSTVAQQAVQSNGQRIVNTSNGEQRVYLTDSQLLWEHMFELQDKYNRLYLKHKKLKHKYNDLYIEDTLPTQPTAMTVQPTTSNEDTQQSAPQEVDTIPEVTQYMPKQSWRTALMNKDLL